MNKSAVQSYLRNMYDQSILDNRYYHTEISMWEHMCALYLRTHGTEYLLWFSSGRDKPILGQAVWESVGMLCTTVFPLAGSWGVDKPLTEDWTLRGACSSNSDWSPGLEKAHDLGTLRSSVLLSGDQHLVPPSDKCLDNLEKIRICGGGKGVSPHNYKILATHWTKAVNFSWHFWLFHSIPKDPVPLAASGWFYWSWALVMLTFL